MVITKDVLAFSRENEETIIDQVFRCMPLFLRHVLSVTFAQISLAEIESVRDMHNDEIASDVQKATLSPSVHTICLLTLKAGFLKRLHDQYHSGRLQQRKDLLSSS